MAQAPPPALLDTFPVFVGHIPDEARPQDLRALFERLGPVNEVVITSTEHGFVSFGNPDIACEAIHAFNGRVLFGRRLHVDYSEELLAHCR